MTELVISFRKDGRQDIKFERGGTSRRLPASPLCGLLLRGRYRNRTVRL